MRPRLCILLAGAVAVSSSPVSTKDSGDNFALPDVSHNYKARAAAIETKRKGWLYEEYPLGGAFYPTGKLANQTISEQQAQWFPIVIEHAKLIAEESVAALSGIIAKGNFSTLNDYANIYENQWKMSLPRGPMLGMLTNYTDDRLFSMMRLLKKTPWGVRPNLENGLKTGEAFTGPQYYPWAPDAARDYLNQLYVSGESADFERNYYRSEFKKRGLIDSSFGPRLKSFPFYEDTTVVTEAIREFMESFINSYYPNDKAVAKDIELQAWYRETTAAQVHDFPQIRTRQAIADVLTHQAYLSVIVSNVMSTNGIHLNSMSLPFAPAGFTQPIPSKKGLTEKDLMLLMPTPEGAVWQVSTYVVGHRPMWRDSNETLSHLFDDETLLARTNPKTRAAAVKFKATMMDFSTEVRARTFDKNGLNRDMPFIWDALDPNYAPFWGVI
ncbi:hypothetical protein NUW58_g291 [Xylaria curta]|uniref:Uncharacterized protein n=1 Tax=Xylaria curta TaxID=42375 RepID=A0ACC1PQ94_9PEZI|nr:hypothetical protein NUW58_g291 [Xylaria curta]